MIYVKSLEELTYRDVCEYTRLAELLTTEGLALLSKASWEKIPFGTNMVKYKPSNAMSFARGRVFYMIEVMEDIPLNDSTLSTEALITVGHFAIDKSARIIKKGVYVSPDLSLTFMPTVIRIAEQVDKNAASQLNKELMTLLADAKAAARTTVPAPLDGYRALLMDDDEVEDFDVDDDNSGDALASFVSNAERVRELALTNGWTIPKVEIDLSLFNGDTSWSDAVKLVPEGALDLKMPPGFLDSDIVPMMLGDDLCLMDYNGFNLWCIIQSEEGLSIHNVEEDLHDHIGASYGDAANEIMHDSGQRFWRLKSFVSPLNCIGVVKGGVIVEEAPSLDTLCNLLNIIIDANSVA